MPKILIIEDETTLLEVYSEFLESEGFEVTTAVDGESGLDIAKNQEWDMMFLDIMLPKLDGIQLLRELRNEGKIGAKPIVMLTNLDSESIVGECVKLGARGHLSKAEINPQTVVDTVNKYLAPKDKNGEETLVKTDT